MAADAAAEEGAFAAVSARGLSRASMREAASSPSVPVARRCVCAPLRGLEGGERVDRLPGRRSLRLLLRNDIVEALLRRRPSCIDGSSNAFVSKDECAGAGAATCGAVKGAWGGGPWAPIGVV